MRIRQHPAASAELDEALVWYAQRNPRAAEGLWREVLRAQAVVKVFPLASPAIGANTRRIVLHAYPYDLIYARASDVIWIVAYAHHKRRPGYWLERLENSH
jgi:plasmid stabilization system protein ParE